MDKKSFLKDNKGEIGAFLVVPIVVIISLVIVSVLGSALIPTAITTASNTSAITGYSTWSAGTQSLFTTVPTFIGLAYMLVYVVIILVAIGIVSKTV